MQIPVGVPIHSDVPFADLDPPHWEMKLRIDDKFYVALCGPNNSGKSLWLRVIQREYDGKSFIIPVNRFLFELTLSPTHSKGYNAKLTAGNFNDGPNHDGTHFDPSHDLQAMSNADRNDILEICSDLIGSRFSIERVDPNNDLSEIVMKVNGQSLRFASTGTRMIVRLISDLKDKTVDRVLIDEPELGMAPALQSRLARLLIEKENREKHFPHLKSVIVATHSHLFLDQNDVRSNFAVRRSGRTFSARQIANVQGLHQLQFNLLGNSLESISLPSAIIIVEGKTDSSFIELAVEQAFPGKRIVVCGSEGDVGARVNQIRTLLGGINGTPYESRTIVILDKVYSAGTVDKLSRMGVPRSHIVTWTKNGIEYFYPPSLVASAFQIPIEKTDALKITDSDVVTATDNGRQMRKDELTPKICRGLRPETEHHPEFQAKLMEPLRAALSTE